MQELELSGRYLQIVMDLMHDSLDAESSKDVLRLIDMLDELIPYNAAILCTIVAGRDGEYAVTNNLNHSYPAGWVQDYYNEKYFLLDPVITVGSKYSDAFSWDVVFPKGHANTSLEKFTNNAQDYSLQNGLSCVFHSKNIAVQKTLISLETTGKAITIFHAQVLQYLQPHFHEAWLKTYRQVAPSSTAPKLTTREREILKWGYEGKTAWEIGAILSISERTVKFHLKNIYHKLDVLNRSQAVAKAMRLGIV